MSTVSWTAVFKHIESLKGNTYRGLKSNNNNYDNNKMKEKKKNDDDDDDDNKHEKHNIFFNLSGTLHITARQNACF